MEAARLPKAATTGWLVLLLLTMSGCSRLPEGGPIESAALVQPSASIVIQANPHETADPSACYDITSDPTGVPVTLNDFHEIAADAIVGRYAGTGQAHWNTPDQKRPTQAQLQSTSSVILRPVTVTEDSTIAGNPNPRGLVLRGGSVGCDTMAFTSDESIMLTPGQLYVFVVLHLNDSLQKPSDNWLVLAAWPLTDKGDVATTADGLSSIGQIKKALANGVDITPGPSEPVPSGPG